MTETATELERHTTVLYEPRRRHFHWLYAVGSTYCGIPRYPQWRLMPLADVPKHGKHVCKRCRKVAVLIKKGINPGHQPRTEVRHPGGNSAG